MLRNLRRAALWSLRWGSSVRWDWRHKQGQNSAFFLDFMYLFLARGKAGERGRETSMCGWLSCTPYWGPGLQPPQVPWLGIQPVTLWFEGWHTIHQDITARARVLFLHVAGWELEEWQSGDHLGDLQQLSTLVIMAKIIGIQQDWSETTWVQLLPSAQNTFVFFDASLTFYYKTRFLLFHISTSLKTECVCILVS